MWRQAALLLSVILGIHAACPSGYTQQDGNCYRLYTAPKSRQDAALQCQLDGATLPIIISSDQDQQILNFARLVGTVWVGLQCASDTNCRFDDLTPFTANSYRNFIGGRPDTRFGKCIIMDENPPYPGAWGSADCSSLNSSFVCQVPYNGVQRMPGYCNQGAVITSYPSVNISTPYYPNAYPLVSSCIWEIYSGTTDSRYRVNATFTDFGLAPDTSVLIYNAYPFSTPAAYYSGARSTPFSVVSSSTRMYILFSSTSAYPQSYRGFSATLSRTSP